MKIFETSKVREIDDYTIRNEPVLSVDLMERAAIGFANWIKQEFSTDTPICVFVGPGNNGGDGWAIARLLAGQGFLKTEVFQLMISHIISPDAEINRNRLIKQGLVPLHELVSSTDFPPLAQDALLIDALFGSGLSRPLEGLSQSLVIHLNNSGCRIISVDIPSGLMGEDNTANPDAGIIRASVTLTFQFPKRSFFYPENEKYDGKWVLIPIGLHERIISSMPADFYYLTHDDISGKLKPRKRFSHKGTFGHALLVAGSYGMTGAAMLAARACLRSGVGLLTTHVPSLIYPIVQGNVPESIFSIDSSPELFTQCPVLDKFTAVAAGPGIGTHEQSARALEILLRSVKSPLILDADALNMLAEHPEMLSLLPENCIITPHPGEFDRISGKNASGFLRNLKQIELSRKYGIIIVLKGANSSVTTPDGQCFFNSTGNPGMATAGSGDVLTGIILALLAQGYDGKDAATTGTFIHGLAGDLAAKDTGEYALIASDIIKNIGKAFKMTDNHETFPHH